MLIRDDRKEGRVVVRRFYFDIIVEESWKPPEEVKILKIKLKKKRVEGRAKTSYLFYPDEGWVETKMDGSGCFYDGSCSCIGKYAHAALLSCACI